MIIINYSKQHYHGKQNQQGGHSLTGSQPPRGWTLAVLPFGVGSLAKTFGATNLYVFISSLLIPFAPFYRCIHWLILFIYSSGVQNNSEILWRKIVYLPHAALPRHRTSAISFWHRFVISFVSIHTSPFLPSPFLLPPSSFF